MNVLFMCVKQQWNYFFLNMFFCDFYVNYGKKSRENSARGSNMKKEGKPDLVLCLMFYNQIKFFFATSDIIQDCKAKWCLWCAGKPRYVPGEKNKDKDPAEKQVHLTTEQQQGQSRLQRQP